MLGKLLFLVCLVNCLFLVCLINCFVNGLVNKWIQPVIKPVLAGPWQIIICYGSSVFCNLNWPYSFYRSINISPSTRQHHAVISQPAASISVCLPRPSVTLESLVLSTLWGCLPTASFNWLPLLLAPLSVPCKAVFARPDDRETLMIDLNWPSPAFKICFGGDNNC